MAVAEPAILYSPHQDDVTLTFGIDIIKHLRAGRRVHRALSDGGGVTPIDVMLDFAESVAVILFDQFAEMLANPQNKVHAPNG